MEQKLDFKRIGIFLGIAFSISWLSALYLYFNGGLESSPEIIPGSKITLAIAVLALVYMGAPAIAHVITRLVTKEGWKDAGLWPRLNQGWKYWLAAWFGPAVLTVLGAAIYFLFFSNQFDLELSSLKDMMKSSNVPANMMDQKTLWLIVASQFVTGLLIAPIINSLFTFGEEFGWRGYLQAKLMPLGGRKTMLLMGVIWGVWHWPVIAMGHNYGTDYPGFPVLGMLAMVWFTFVVGTFLGWITLKGGSVWPAVIGHAAVNGIAGIAIFLVKSEPNLLIGPMPVGLLGSAGYSLVTLALFLIPGALMPAMLKNVEELPPLTNLEG